MRHTVVESPLGPIVLAAHDDALAGVWFVGQRHFPVPEHLGERVEPDDEPVLARAAAELAEYLAGARTTFDVPTAAAGTAFQRAVWEAVAAIGYGATRTYAQVADDLGRPTAVRAVAAAVGRNPLCLVVPCHRVVGSDGSLTGYAGGLERKEWLLALEGASRRGPGQGGL
jgi:methylated-DNA-[protein]-cysteine S-methyltransferase